LALWRVAVGVLSQAGCGGQPPGVDSVDERLVVAFGLVEPGIVAVSDWRAEDQPSQRPVTSDLGIYAAVGKKL